MSKNNYHDLKQINLKRLAGSKSVVQGMTCHALLNCSLIFY